jgi:hypothetical protein
MIYTTPKIQTPKQLFGPSKAAHIADCSGVAATDTYNTRINLILATLEAYGMTATA